MSASRRHWDRHRGSAGSRGYDRDWAAHAVAYRRQHPWCLGCAAIGVRKATDVVDHTRPHRGDRALFNDPTNRQPACAWHHNAIKPIIEAMFERGEVAAAALQLDSPEAIKLTKAKYRPVTAGDGWPT